MPYRSHENEIHGQIALLVTGLSMFVLGLSYFFLYIGDEAYSHFGFGDLLYLIFLVAFVSVGLVLIWGSCYELYELEVKYIIKRLKK